MNLSVRAKIVLITVAILFFAVGANTLISSYVFATEYSHALQSETLVIAQTLRLQLDKLLRLGIAIEDLVGFEEQCQDVVSEYEEISYAMVVDPDGKILFHNDPSQRGTTLTDSATLEAVKGTESTTQVYSTREKRYYDVVIPVSDTHGEHIAAVRIGFPVELVTQKTGRLLAYSVGVACVSFVLATILLISVTSETTESASIMALSASSTILSSPARINITTEWGSLHFSMKIILSSPILRSSTKPAKPKFAGFKSSKLVVTFQPVALASFSMSDSLRRLAAIIPSLDR